MAAFLKACVDGDLTKVQQLPPDDSTDYLNCGLARSCNAGHLPIVEFLISKGANDWNWGLENACENGNLAIVELMIAKGADNWSAGWEHACYYGHIQIIELLRKKGMNSWNFGLSQACMAGNRELVNLMISKGANDWALGLESACLHNNLEIAEFMLRCGATCYDVLNWYKINPEILVHEYGLSLSILQRISKLKYDTIRNDLRRKASIHDCILLIDLGQILSKYLVCF